MSKYILKGYRVHWNKIPGKKGQYLGTHLELTLDQSGEWCIATNTPLSSDNPRELGHVFLHSSRYSSWTVEGSKLDSVWIEGPKGGCYHVSNGKLMR